MRPVVDENPYRASCCASAAAGGRNSRCMLMAFIHLNSTTMATTKKEREKPPLPMPINWRDAVPNDRLGHVIKDAARAMARGLQIRLMEHSLSRGHWPFLRILWERDGLTQRELSELAGLREPTAYNAL